MVLAVAALLFQVAVGPAVTPSSDNETPAAAADTSTPRVPNLDSIKLGDQPAFVDKSSSPAPLKTVAYNTSTSQKAQSLSTIRVPEINPAKQPEIRYAETYPSRQWIALSIVQSAAAGFDAYSTRYAVGHGAIEEDPLMRPFAHSPSIYAVSQLCPVALDFLARHMERSPNVFIRRMWWLPQSTATGMYLFSGVHNMHVASQIQH